MDMVSFILDRFGQGIFMDGSKAMAAIKNPLVLGGTPLVLTLVVLFQARSDFQEVGANVVEQVKRNTVKVESLEQTMVTLGKEMVVLGKDVERLTDAIKTQTSDHDKLIALETELKGLKSEIARMRDRDK